MSFHVVLKTLPWPWSKQPLLLVDHGELSYDHSVVVYMKIEALEGMSDDYLMIKHGVVKVERSYILYIYIYCNTWQSFQSQAYMMHFLVFSLSHLLLKSILRIYVLVYVFLKPSSHVLMCPLFHSKACLKTCYIKPFHPMPNLPQICLEMMSSISASIVKDQKFFLTYQTV